MDKISDILILLALITLIVIFTIRCPEIKVSSKPTLAVSSSSPEPFIDPNIIYTRRANCSTDNVNSNATMRFSRQYRQELGIDDSNSKYCKPSGMKSSSVCNALKSSQAAIPAAIQAECAEAEATAMPAPSPTSSSLQNYTDDELDALVYKYAVLTSQRNPQAPWDFNPYVREGPL